MQEEDLPESFGLGNQECRNRNGGEKDKTRFPDFLSSKLSFWFACRLRSSLGVTIE